MVYSAFYALVGLVSIALAIGLFLYRWRWMSTDWSTRSHPPSSSFEQDLEHGLSSELFDLTENINSGDPRGGLDDRDKALINKTMHTRGCNFDEARRLLMVDKMKKVGINPRTGRPMDPKAVFFS